MKPKISTLVTPLMTCVFLLSACSSPATTASGQDIPGLAPTLAAQTLTALEGMYSPFLTTPTQPATHPAVVAQAPANPAPSGQTAKRSPAPQETPSLNVVQVEEVDKNCTNAAEFVQDISIPDDTVLQPNQRFTKTWRFKNVGTCTWKPEYRVVLVGGERMGELDSVALGRTVAPGESVNISIALMAPKQESCYQSNWMFQDTQGNTFGTGEERSNSFWLSVNVRKTAMGTIGMASIGGG